MKEVWYASKWVTTSPKVQRGSQNISIITQITSFFKSTINNKNHYHASCYPLPNCCEPEEGEARAALLGLETLS
jgi:hypothetical protein